MNRWKIKNYYTFFSCKARVRKKVKNERIRKQFISVPGSIQVNNQRKVKDKKKITYNIFNIYFELLFSVEVVKHLYVVENKNKN